MTGTTGVLQWLVRKCRRSRRAGRWCAACRLPWHSNHKGRVCNSQKARRELSRTDTLHLACLRDCLTEPLEGTALKGKGDLGKLDMLQEGNFKGTGAGQAVPMCQKMGNLSAPGLDGWSGLIKSPVKYTTRWWKALYLYHHTRSLIVEIFVLLEKKHWEIVQNSSRLYCRCWFHFIDSSSQTTK